MIDTYLGAQKAFTSLAGIPYVGPALGAVAAATAIAAGMQRVNMIQSMEYQGQAHGGLDRVPRTGTYLLEEGEKVVKKSDAKNSGGGNVFHQVVYVDASNSSGINIEHVRQAAKEGAEGGYHMIMRDFQRNGPARKLIK